MVTTETHLLPRNPVPKVEVQSTPCQQSAVLKWVRSCYRKACIHLSVLLRSVVSPEFARWQYCFQDPRAERRSLKEEAAVAEVEGSELPADSVCTTALH